MLEHIMKSEVNGTKQTADKKISYNLLIISFTIIHDNLTLNVILLWTGCLV